MVEVLNPGMQAQKFLCAFSPSEALLLPFLTPCSAVGLLNHVITARCGAHLLVVDLDQVRDLPDRRSITPQLIGADRVWDLIFAE